MTQLAFLSKSPIALRCLLCFAVALLVAQELRRGRGAWAHGRRALFSSLSTTASFFGFSCFDMCG